MLILFKTVLHCLLAKCRELSHLINNLIINRHRVETNNKSDYLWFNRLYFFEEIQLSYFRDSDSFGRLSHQHFLNNFNGFDADVTWKYIKAFNNLFVELLRCFLFKWEWATNHSIEYDTQWPNISDNSIIGFSWHHFRRCIARTSTGSCKELAILVIVG